MELPQLNFPNYDFRVRWIRDKAHIYDDLRKKYVVITPEEWVRQHLVRFLIREKQYPRGLIQVEATIRVYEAARRCDVAVFNRDMQPWLLAECKAPEVTINEATFLQIATYNSVLQAPFLLVSNGLTHFCCRLEAGGGVTFLEDIPGYEEMA